MKWHRAVLSIACRGSAGDVASRVKGYRLGDPEAACWGVHRSYGRWTVDHLPTGMAAAYFDSFATAKRFAEEMAAAVDGRIGRFGQFPKSRRSPKVAAFLRAGIEKRAAFMCDPVKPVLPAGAVEYGP